MKTALPVFILSVCAAACFASGSGSQVASGSSYIIARAVEKTAAVSVEIDAEFVSISVDIESSQKTPAAQFTQIKQVQEAILNAAKEREDIVIYRGPIALSAEPRKGWFEYSSYYRPGVSAAQFYVLAAIGEGMDMYDAALRIRQFLDSVNIGKANWDLGPIQLAVRDPQRYRGAILTKISKDAEFVKDSLWKDSSVTLTGLNNPVLVRQVDNRRVELFIEYTMALNIVAD
jgi:hypothetical protein